jgi:hypothetical protein
MTATLLVAWGPAMAPHRYRVGATYGAHILG